MMAQTTSYEIDNDSGAAVRARLNDVFAAIQSSNSGATPPADTAPGMLWLDTSGSPSVLFRRNAADSDWVRVVPEIASQAEAQAGTDNTKLMTPLRTAQAIDELSTAPSELTEAQVTDDTSTVFGTVSGQRLAQQTNEAFNVSGAAPKYACRAWVNFNGATTSPTIRASGNVSSVTRTATGRYTVNFTTAMPNANYSLLVSGATTTTNNTDRHGIPGNSEYNTTSCVVSSGSSGSNSLINFDFMHVAIFR